MRKIIYIDNFLTGHGHTPSTGTTLVKQLIGEGYRIVSSSSKQNKILRLTDMVFTIITNRKNSIVLIATYSGAAFYFANACALVCRVCKIAYIPCLHGGNLPDRIKQSPKLSSFYFGNSYTNVAVSGYLKHSMDANGWQCVEIPNNIPIENYPYKHRHSISPTLFWVRSFHKSYNPQLAIKLLHRLRKKYPAATLKMIGPDKNDNSLEKCKKVVKELSLEKWVSFEGLLSQKEWIEQSANSDIFINTTNFDNLPVSVIEAMALGMVIISTNVGGVPYLLEDGKTGLMVPGNDQDAFVEAIDRVLSDPQCAASLSEAAHLKAQQFDWKNVKALWKSLFDRIPL